MKGLFGTLIGKAGKSLTEVGDRLRKLGKSMADGSAVEEVATMPISPASDLGYREVPITAGIAKELEEQRKSRKEIIDFGQGRPEPPDFDVPKSFKKAKQEAIDLGKFVYTPTAGLPALREKLAEEMSLKTGIDYAPSEILVGIGGRGPLHLALDVVVDNDDSQYQVLCPVPYWPTYPELIKSVGGQMVTAKLYPPNFKLRNQEVAKIMNYANLAAVLINEPHNPTGTVEIVDSEKLMEFNQKRDEAYQGKRPVPIIYDSLYSSIVFDPDNGISFPKSKNFKPRAIIIDGISKTFNATGLRVGWAAGPENLIKAMADLQHYWDGNAPSDTQYALWLCLTKYRDPIKSEVAEIVRKHKEIADYAVKALSGIKGVEIRKPEGTFYLWMKIPLGIGCRYRTDFEFAMGLAKNEGVGVVPGTACGCPGYVRLSLAVSWEKLKKGLEKIRTFIEKNQ